MSDTASEGGRREPAILLDAASALGDALIERTERDELIGMRIEDVDRYADAAAVVDRLIGRPDLLLRLAYEAGAILWYSICSAHQTEQPGCERCLVGSFGVQFHEGQFVGRYDPPFHLDGPCSSDEPA